MPQMSSFSPSHGQQGGAADRLRPHLPAAPLHGAARQLVLLEGGTDGLQVEFGGEVHHREILPVEALVRFRGGQGAGGKPDFAQGGAPDGSKAEDGLAAVRAALA